MRGLFDDKIVLSSVRRTDDIPYTGVHLRYIHPLAKGLSASAGPGV